MFWEGVEGSHFACSCHYLQSLTLPGLFDFWEKKKIVSLHCHPAFASTAFVWVFYYLVHSCWFLHYLSHRFLHYLSHQDDLSLPSYLCPRFCKLCNDGLLSSELLVTLHSGRVLGSGLQFPLVVPSHYLVGDEVNGKADHKLVRHPAFSWTRSPQFCRSLTPISTLSCLPAWWPVKNFHIYSVWLVDIGILPPSKFHFCLLGSWVLFTWISLKDVCYLDRKYLLLFSLWIVVP